MDAPSWTSFVRTAKTHFAGSRATCSPRSRSNRATSSPPAVACRAARGGWTRCARWAPSSGCAVTSPTSSHARDGSAVGRCSSARRRSSRRSIARASHTTRARTSRSTRAASASTRWWPACSPRSGKRMPHAFSDRLAESALLCDGAMGTVLYARGVPLDACFDVLNLNNPRVVQAVHADYIGAGADCIETNTFGANRFKLAVHGLESQAREINRRGARLARDVRESAGRDVWVLGSIGPLGKYLEPLGTVTADEAREAFREQAEALLEGGVDAIVVETFSDLAEIALVVEAIRLVTDLPIVAQMAFTDEGVTFMGRPPAEVARTLRALGVQALGANCSVGSSTLYDVLERMGPEAGGVPLAIQPNAGLPSRIGERLIYLSSPAYMAEYAGRMVEAGARLVGGCCGTTPAHTAAMRETLDRRIPGPRRVVARAPAPRPTVLETPGIARTLAPTLLQRRLEAREFV